MPPAEAPPQTAPEETLSQQDKQFVTEAAEGGMTEVELSKIAEKSSSPEVKHFAERMVRDHSTANAELTSIATGLEIEMPKTLAPLAPKDPRSAEEHARQGLRPALYAPDGRRP